MTVSKVRSMARCAAFILSLPLLTSALQAENQLRIAVASNFHHTLQSIADAFEAAQPDCQIVLIPGSSGKLYAQIQNSAAFHAFFSADRERPQRLEEHGLAQNGSRFTFALGKLAFWQPGATPATFSQSKTIAIANPQTAPYGRAAAQAGDHLPLAGARIVTASSVSQSFFFAQSGAADSAFVAYAQLLQLSIPAEQFIIVDPSLYDPIEQQAIALSDSPLVHAFFAFCKSPETRSKIAAAGYRLP